MIRMWCGLCLVLMLLGLAGGVAWAQEDPRQLAVTLVQQAGVLYEQKDYGQAEKLLLAAYKLYPSEKLQFSLGRVYEAQGRREDAVRAFRRFLEKIRPAERKPGQTEDVTAALQRLGATEQKPVEAPKTVQPAEPPKPPKRVETIPAPEPTPKAAVVTAQRREVARQEGSTGRRRGLRIAKWIIGGIGLAGLATGGVLWGLNGHQTCALQPGFNQCMQVLTTGGIGIGLFSGGAVLIGVSAILFAVDAHQQYASVTSYGERRGDSSFSTVTVGLQGGF